MSTYAPAPASDRPLSAAARAPSGAARFGHSSRVSGWAVVALPALLTAGLLCFSTFVATGGLDLETRTTVELALTLLAGVAGAVAIAAAPRDAPLNGAWSIGLLFGLTALTAISVGWSVSPDASWQEAGLLLCYSSVFGAVALLARATPVGWRGVLAGIVIAAVVVCGYALLTKVFPAQLDRNDVYARLRAPYGYWNATGLSAAMGILACLWLGARRTGHALLSALAYPAIGLLMVTLMLAYSRGALAVALIGVATWLCIVPLRLRGALMLLVCGACAAAVVGFVFSTETLSSEGVALTQRVSAGHQLGVLLLALIVVLALAGVAIGFALSSHPPSQRTRRRAGIAMFALLALVVLACIGALASTQRGLTGTISHDLSSVTNPNATVANTPGRLTAVASARARYWKQAIEVFEAHPALGTGGGGYATARKQYETGTQEVTHAHGYIVQTLADLGLVGIALTLALLGAWMVAAGRATHPCNRRWSRWRWRAVQLPYSPERIGLLSMLCIVIAFGLHSLVDWTWYVPGTAFVGLICAGWLAGRGAIEAPVSASPDQWRHLMPNRITPLRAAVACATIVAALLAAWSQWQPQRSYEAAQEAPTLPNAGAALAEAHTAISRDPLSLTAMLTLASVQEAFGYTDQARATRRLAVRRQPANPLAWRVLGEHDLSSDPHAALAELRAAYYLYPNFQDRNDYVAALNAVAALKTARAVRLPADRYGRRAGLPIR
jgi:hypothetical protein